MIVVGKLRRRNKFSHSFFIDHSVQDCQEFLPEKVLTAANVTLSLTKFVIAVGIHFGTIELGTGQCECVISRDIIAALVIWTPSHGLTIPGLRDIN